MEKQVQTLEKIGSIASHGLLIGRYSVGTVLRTIPVIKEKASDVAQAAILKVPLFDSQLLAQRVESELADVQARQDNDDILVHGTTKAEYKAALASSEAQAAATKRAKDAERERKEREAQADELLEVYPTIIEPSDAATYKSFDDAVVGRQIGQLVFAGVSE